MRSRGTAAPAAGAVRVRPAGETAPAQRNRYQYVVAGESPRASTFTVWSRSGPVPALPLRTIRRKPASAATSQRTVTAGPTPEPGVAAAVGLTRVHRTTASGSGSPEATPCRNTPVARAGPAATALEAGVTTRAAPATAPAWRARRRVRGGSDGVTTCTLSESARGCAPNVNIHPLFGTRQPGRTVFPLPTGKRQPTATGPSCAHPTLRG